MCINIIAKCIAIVAFSTTMATIVSAQGYTPTKADFKAAKKVAKELKKEGWIVSPGNLSLEEQIVRGWGFIRDADNWIIGEAIVSAPSHDDAYDIADYQARVNLTKKMDEIIKRVEEREKEYSQFSASKYKEYATAQFEKEIGHKETIFNCYRTLKDGTYEVHLRYAVRWNEQEIRKKSTVSNGPKPSDDGSTTGKTKTDPIQTAPLPPANSSSKRYAFILANADYPKGRLANPANDAIDIGKKLKSLGFNTVIRINEQKGESRETISQFCKDAKQYDAVLFYYAGHAVQNQGSNYLVPINAKIDSRADILDECISLNWILGKMNESGVKTQIVVLDACRDNPIINSWEQDMEGLTSISSVPEGTYLVYSVQSGRKAKDGIEKRNSPFAEALLEVLDIPMLPVHDLFHRVKNIVAEKTGKTQIPSEINNLLGDFYFNMNQRNEK